MGYDEPPGTLICDEEEIVEKQVVTGIAYSKDEAQITLRRVADKPGVAAAVFMPLAEANINVDMIVQNISEDGSLTDMTFTVPIADFDRAQQVLEASREQIGYQVNAGLERRRQDLGHRHRHAQPCRRRGGGFQALAARGINIRAITTSEIKISMLIDASYTELAVRTLHSLYGLDNY